ncbi:hypothetical protein WKV44_02085 [Spirochaetia bacterium 38H-sp]|uniref:histidine kinase n=1 Tax=Rarispira pelagica TaxID=3141764 RepID=A0ABU9UA14_9SPIR
MKQELFKKTDRFFKRTRLWVASIIIIANILALWLLVFYARYYMALNMQRAIRVAEAEATELVVQGHYEAKMLVSIPGMRDILSSSDNDVISTALESIVSDSGVFSSAVLITKAGISLFSTDERFHKAALWREPYYKHIAVKKTGELFTYGVYFSPVFFEPACVYIYIVPNSDRALVFYLDMTEFRKRALYGYNSAFNVDIFFTDLLGYPFLSEDFDENSAGYEKFLVSRGYGIGSYTDKKGISWFFSFKWLDDISMFVITRVKKVDFLSMLWPLAGSLWFFSVLVFIGYSVWNSRIYLHLVLPLRKLVITSSVIAEKKGDNSYEDEISFIDAAVRKGLIERAGAISFPIPLVFIVMEASGKVLKKGGQLASYFINLEEGDSFPSQVAEPSAFENDVAVLKGGQKQVVVSYSVFSDNGTQPVEGVMVMLPDSNRLLLLLTVSRDFVSDELNKMYLLETMGNVLGSVADSFSNILTGIKGNLDLLIRDKELSSIDNNRVDAILSELARAGKISRQLLAFSNGMSFRPENVVLSSILSSALSSLSDERRKRVDVISDPSIELKLDETLFSHALCNVFDFIFARLSSSRVEVRIFMSGNRPVYGAPEGDYICISIFARSLFISEEEVRWIFKPYEKTGFSVELLGMPVAYQILKRHKGYMLFNSHLDGTSIDMFIPE